ncbi:MAG: shikimate dehydrogenase [Candidatus Thorarchaeota archaeon]
MKRIVLVGNPVEHSYSPVMHNAAFKALDLQHEYQYSLLPLESDELTDFVESIATGRLEGANVTIPYKRSIMAHLSDISEEAKSVGAVNTIYRKQDRIVGCNTDIVGIIQLFKTAELGIEGTSAVVLGAGGAARAVAFALSKMNAEKVFICNRTLSKAQQLVREISNRFSVISCAGSYPLAQDFLEQYDLLVNCTPLGMKGHSIGETPIKKEFLTEDLVVMDLVYNPLETRLLRAAEGAGCRTINGAHLLIEQGAASFEKWTGLNPPVDVMRTELLKQLENDSQ